MKPDPSAKKNELGELIARHRKAQGRSARDVAREAGIDIHTMTMVERGRYAAPSPFTLKGIGKALGIPLLVLFRAAGYITPYDLIDMVKNYQPEAEFAAHDDAEARNRYIEKLIEEYGLENVEPDSNTLAGDH